MLESLIIGYVLLSIVIGICSFNKRIGFGTTLSISLLLTPIAGIVAVIKSDNFLRRSSYTTRYQCPECNMEFTEPHDCCPFCKENHLEISLNEVKLLQTAIY